MPFVWSIVSLPVSRICQFGSMLWATRKTIFPGNQTLLWLVKWTNMNTWRSKFQHIHEQSWKASMIPPPPTFLFLILLSQLLWMIQTLFCTPSHYLFISFPFKYLFFTIKFNSESCIQTRCIYSNSIIEQFKTKLYQNV